jgi:hypothetical protein
MFESPASAASDSHPSSGYFCAACRRRHDGQPFGSVGTSLDYCESAITHLFASGVIVKDGRPAAGPQQYWLIKRD